MIIDINQENFLSELQKYVGKTGYKFIIRQEDAPKKRICTEKIISFGANCVNDGYLDVEIDTPEFEISKVLSVEIIKKRKGKENG
jgi:hypothetical protein